MPPKKTFRRAPLGSLRVFVAVAQQLSISRAADMLGVSASAVSMQIKALEDYLRVPLLRREGRNVELTAEGARLLPPVERSLRELEDAIDEIRADRRGGELTITILPSFLQQWLLPRLPDFQAQHPQVQIAMHTSVDIVDLRQSRIQVAIRMGKGDWPGLHVEKLLDEWLVPVCTRELFDRHGPVLGTGDLARYPLVHSTSEPWSAWTCDDSGEERPARGIAFDDSVSVLRAAAAGQGLALARWSLVAEEIQLGRLVLAARRAARSDWSYYFVCRPDYVEVEKVGAFRGWVRRQAAAFAPPASLKRS